MEVYVNNDLSSQHEWCVSYGKYYKIKYDEDALAIEYSNINVESMDIVYDKNNKILQYFPHGTFECSECKKIQNVCSKNNIWILSYIRPEFYSNVAYCEECKIKYYLENPHIKLIYFRQFKFNDDSIKALREKACEKAKMQEKRHALNTIRPYIIHWAFRFNGPCYHIAKRRFEERIEMLKSIE